MHATSSDLSASGVAPETANQTALMTLLDNLLTSDCQAAYHWRRIRRVPDAHARGNEGGRKTARCLVGLSFWLVALTFLVCGCGRKGQPPEVPQRDAERLSEVTAQLAQLDKLESDSVRLTVVLDGRLRAGQVSPANPEQDQSGNADMAVRLKAMDSDLNKTLTDVYNRASVLPIVDRSAAETRAALTHYRVLLRRASMRGYHTEVPGLDEDPDCSGDFTGDELLGKYFGAVISTSDASRATAIAVLSDMGRQSACLGTEQMHSLANDFYSAFAELQVFLRANGREYLIPFVAQALANPLLIFYDVEKAYGKDGPLARWFLEQRAALREAEASRRLALLWHGLWLYDRVTGRMIGFTANAAAADENFVALDLLWPSLTSTMNLGDNNCSLAEMVQRGPGPNGYQCLGYTCATESGSGLDPNLRTTASAFRFSRLQSPTDKDVFMQSLSGCSQSGADPRTGAGGNLCAAGAASSVAGRAAKEVRCVSKTIVQPGTEAMQCLSEVTGRCSNPVQQLTKELRQTTYAGVKLGKDCLIGAGKKDGKKPDDKKSEEEKKKQQEQKRQEEERKKQEEEARRQEAEKKIEEWKEQLKKAAEARQKADEEAKKAAAARQASDEAASRMKEQKVANDAYIRAWNDFKNAWEAEQKAKDQMTLYLAEEQDRLQHANDLVKQLTGGKQNPVCDPGEGCPNNDCTGMASAMDKAMECTGKKLADKQQLLSQGPGSCDPTVCDNFEPGKKESRGWEACIFQMDNAVKDAANRQCWMTRCANNETAILMNGRCTCNSALTNSGAVGGGLRTMCEYALCTGDAALGQGSTARSGGSNMAGWLNGGCSCGVPNGMTGAGAGITPPKLVTLPPAPTFSERNRGTLTPPGTESEPQPRVGDPGLRDPT